MFKLRTLKNQNIEFNANLLNIMKTHWSKKEETQSEHGWQSE